MIIKHNLKFPRNEMDGQLALSKLQKEIPNFYNWIVILKNQKLEFEHDSKFRIPMRASDMIPSGTIELIEKDNSLIFTCKTNFSDKYILFVLGMMAALLVPYFILESFFPLFIILSFPLFLYFSNLYLRKRSFKLLTKKVIKHVIENSNSSD